MKLIIIKCSRLQINTGKQHNRDVSEYPKVT